MHRSVHFGRSALSTVLLSLLVILGGFGIFMGIQAFMPHAAKDNATQAELPQPPMESAQAKSPMQDLIADIDLTHDPLYKPWLNGQAGFDEARKIQKKTHQPMVVYFYAPWCPHCKEFHVRLLKSPLVQNALKKYILVRNFPDQDSPTGKADQRMMREFGANGFPTMYIANPGKRYISIDLAAPDGSDYYLPSEFITAMHDALKHSD